MEKLVKQHWTPRKKGSFTDQATSSNKRHSTVPYSLARWCGDRDQTAKIGGSKRINVQGQGVESSFRIMVVLLWADPLRDPLARHPD